MYSMPEDQAEQAKPTPYHVTSIDTDPIGESSASSSSSLAQPAHPSQPAFAFPTPAPADGPRRESIPPMTTPRRRAAAPTKIPHYPSSNEVRTPAPAIPSPMGSPARSPFRSPTSTPPQSQSFLGRLPTPQPLAAPFGVSPWSLLAATSGAPTPSIDGPSRKGNSHLGYPFENLSIDSSWSGGNLNQGGDQVASQGGSDSFFPGLSAPPPPLSSSPAIGGASGSGAGFGLNPSMVLGKKRAPPTPAGEESMPLDPPASTATSSTSGPRLSLPASLAKRRGSIPKGILGVPTSTHATKSPSPLASSSKTSPSPGINRMRPITIQNLEELLTHHLSTLVLDVRPPSEYQSSHLPTSHSIPLPSTLLRRPAFNLERLASMLPTESSEAIGHWREMSDIVLLDSDASQAADGSVLDGLAGKFQKEGFVGHLWYVKGGHSAVMAAGMNTDATTKEDEREMYSGPSITPAQGLVTPKGLGQFAFESGQCEFQSRIEAAVSRLSHISGSTKSGRPLGLRLPPVETPSAHFHPDPFSSVATTAATERPRSIKTDSSKRSSGRSSGKLSTVDFQAAFQDGPDGSRPKHQRANPFFDNIRQNLELSHGGIVERIELQLPEDITERSAELPGFLADLVNLPRSEAAEQLAQQFYQLELGEQKRLQAIMDFHSKGSGAAIAKDMSRRTDNQKQRDSDAVDVGKFKGWVDAQAIGGPESPSETYFPFSITAGVERGAKNRYKNIWPYDFSRVRLGVHSDEDSDYINASFVQPRGTNRRYIATQGPLDATYRDFWTLIWEQDVRVIVMLTKQYEAGQVKCGNYWEAQHYGPIHVQLTSHVGEEDAAPNSSAGFDFGFTSPAIKEAKNVVTQNIKRTFFVTHDDFPDSPRKVEQIQCVSWPDFDVPNSPDVLLSLIKEVDDAMDHLCTTNECKNRADQPPVLVHCSAGIGRTGSFIIVDAILDGLRHERQEVGVNDDEEDQVFVRDDSDPAPTTLDASSIIPSTIRLSNNGSIVKSHLDPVPEVESIDTPAPEIPVGPTGMDLDRVTTTADGTDRPESAEYNTASNSNIAPSFQQFQKHRGSISISDSVSSKDSRPGISGTHSYGSSRQSADQATTSGAEQPRAMANGQHRTRAVTPLSEMDHPVADVLESMRIQRMSLVQSLRQYVFVHRAIIQHFFNTLDNADSSSPEAEAIPKSSSSTFPTTTSLETMATSASTSVSSAMDDEAHIKRRASPTELIVDPEEDVVGPLTDGFSLVKRPSFKKMRPSFGNDAITGTGGSSSTSLASANSAESK